jgi:hypothetical protein
MSIDALEDIRSKVQRAEKNIEDFRAVVERFKATNPYHIVRQPDIKAGQIVYYVLKADPIPPSIRAIAGDVLQNLRTALDYLACALVPDCRKGGAGHIYFPILNRAPTPEQIKTAFDGKVKGASEEAIKKIASLNPHKGGDDILWRLNALNNINKHRLLVAVQASASLIVPQKRPIRLGIDEPAEVAQILAETLVAVTGGFPLKQGRLLYADSSLLKPDDDVKFLVQITVNERDVCIGVPLIAVLRESFKRVTSIVGKFIPLLSKC